MDIEVIQTSDNYELKGGSVALEDYTQFRVSHRKAVSKQFKDDFDYEYYMSTVFEDCDSSDKDAVLTIKI